MSPKPLPKGSSVVVCEVCNVVLARDGERVENRPMTACSHLRGAKYVALDALVSDEDLERVVAYLEERQMYGDKGAYAALDYIERISGFRGADA